MHHLWRVRSVAVGNVKSWRRVSIPGWRWVWELLVASTVVYLQRPVVRVAHVHCSDDRGRWGMLQALVSQKARWVLSVCHRLQDRCYPSCCWHCLKPPGSWNLAEAGESPGSAGSLWRGSRAPHCCHFSQGYNIIITENIFMYIYYCHYIHFCPFFGLLCDNTNTNKEERTNHPNKRQTKECCTLGSYRCQAGNQPRRAQDFHHRQDLSWNRIS